MNFRLSWSRGCSAFRRAIHGVSLIRMRLNEADSGHRYSRKHHGGGGGWLMNKHCGVNALWIINLHSRHGRCVHFNVKQANVLRPPGIRTIAWMYAFGIFHGENWCIVIVYGNFSSWKQREVSFAFYLLSFFLLSRSFTT